jgi:6-phosphogluconolactonase (cycloisomerase 2 family)
MIDMLKKELKMKKVILSVIFTIAILVGLVAAFSTAASADQGPDWLPGFGNGAVFTMTNAVTETPEKVGPPVYTPAPNAVIMFSRDANGMLTSDGSFATGGDGGLRSGPPDPLVSQGSLVLTQDGKWLLAVNAGSNSISVFQVEKNKLSLVGATPSGGNFPVSITIFGNEVFVLNAGTMSNITGFTLSNTGTLTPIAGSTRLVIGASVMSVFSQVGFDNTGKWLIVTDKSDSLILAFPVSSGIPGAEVKSTSDGPAPFGLAFDGQDHLLVVQAGNSAVASYSVMPSGMLSPIVEAFNPTSSTACWIVKDQMGNVFTTNPGSMNISSYEDLDNSGNVGWLNPSAASGITTIDEGITNNSQYLYALAPGVGIDGYKISFDGSLKMVGTFTATGITATSQGLAAW